MRPTNTPSTEELLMLLGFKEVEIYTLLQQVRSLTVKVAELQNKLEPPTEAEQHD